MIDLTGLKIAGGTSPRLLDWGGELSPPLGGVTTRIDRLGTRHAIDVVVPPQAMEPDGRVWISRLKRAKREGGRVAFPQVDFVVGNPGAPKVFANIAAGSTMSLTGFAAGYAIREGQWFSVTHAGRSYLYSSDVAITADGSGRSDFPITPMLRSQLSANDVVNFAEPVLEGWVSGDELAWTLEASRTVGLQFTVTERA